MSDGSTIPWPLAAQQQQAPQSGGGIPIPSGGTGMPAPPHSAAEMAQLALGAATPTSGGHDTTIPRSLQPTQKQFVPAPGSNRPAPPGKGNARGQGIGNAVIGVLNAATAIKTGMDNKKQLALATDAHTAFTAQQSIDQAKQILSSDPDNAAAKDSLKHNTDVLQGVLAGDNGKTGERIMKGLGIDYTDPKKNDTPEHRAIAQAKTMSEKGAALADAFGKAVPTTMAPNQPAIAKYQQAVKDNKDYTDFAKAVAPAQIRAAGQTAVEAMRASNELQIKMAEAQNSWNKMNAEFKLKMQTLGAEHKNRLAEIGASGAQTRQNDIFRINAEANNPASIVKNSDESQTQWTNNINKIDNQIGAYQAQLANPATPEAQKADINSAIQGLSDYKEQAQIQAGISAAYYTTKKTALGLPVGGSNGPAAPDKAAPKPGADPTPALNGWQGSNYLTLPSSQTNPIL